MASLVRLGDRNFNKCVSLLIFCMFQFGNDRVWSEQADRSRKAINGSIEDTLNRKRVFKDGSLMLLRTWKGSES